MPCSRSIHAALESCREDRAIFEGHLREGITRLKSLSKQLVAFANSSFAENKQDRRWVSREAVWYVDGVVSWFSRTQHFMSISPAESEYVAVTEVTREVIFLGQVLDFIQPGRVVCAVTRFEVKGGAIKFEDSPIFTNRTKHIDVRDHFVRETIANQTLKIVHVESEEQATDGLTKTLLGAILISHRKTSLNE